MKSAKRLVITTSVGLCVTGIVNCPALLDTAAQRALIAEIKRKYGSTGVLIKERPPAREVEPVGVGE